LPEERWTPEVVVEVGCLPRQRRGWLLALESGALISLQEVQEVEREFLQEVEEEMMLVRILPERRSQLLLQLQEAQP
jgi:hypothetical protein